MNVKMKNISQAEVLVLKEQIAYQEGQVVSKTLAQNDALSITLFSFAKGRRSALMNPAAMLLLPAWTEWGKSPLTVWIIFCTKVSPSLCPPGILTQCMEKRRLRCC